jgi:NADH dehydrogenase
MARPRVVIIGGGFGGLSAARTFTRAQADITLVDRHNHHLFSPLLYQVATAGLSPGDIASPIRYILRKQKNLKVWLGEAIEIKPAQQIVALRDGGQIPYDYLIVAAGGRTSYFGHDEWMAHCQGLKTMDDALEIRRRVLFAFELAERERDREAQRRLLTFVVVGGGATGVELAGALAEISRHALAHDFRAIHPESARIILIEGGEQVLGTYPEPLSAFARTALERLGVTVWTGSPVTDLREGQVVLGQETIEAATVLWAAGIAAVPLTRTLGVPLDGGGRVKVHPDLTIPDHPDVYVVGDAATLAGDDGKPLPGVAQVAMQQARWAAENILRTMKNEARQPFRYRNLGNVATIGRHSAVCDMPWLRLKGYLAWWFWLGLHIFKLIGFRNRLTVITQWAFSYMTYQRSVRLITGRLTWPNHNQSSRTT